MDNEAPSGPVDESGEPWVSDTSAGAQRVPGIDEAQEAMYVDPQQSDWRRPVLIGVAIGFAVTGIFAAIVLSPDSGGTSKETDVDVGISATSTTTRETTTTTTADWWTRGTSTTTAPPAAPAATTPSTTTSAGAPAAAVTPATHARPPILPRPRTRPSHCRAV